MGQEHTISLFLPKGNPQIFQFKQWFSAVFISERDIAHGAMGRRIDHPWCEPIELFLGPVSAPRLV